MDSSVLLDTGNDNVLYLDDIDDTQNISLSVPGDLRPQSRTSRSCRKINLDQFMYCMVAVNVGVICIHV